MRPPEGEPGEGTSEPSADPPAPTSYPPVYRPNAQPDPEPTAPEPTADPAPTEVAPSVPTVEGLAADPGPAPTVVAPVVTPPSASGWAEAGSTTVVEEEVVAPLPRSGRGKPILFTILGIAAVIAAIALLVSGGDDDEADLDATGDTAGQSIDKGEVVTGDTLPSGEPDPADPENSPNDPDAPPADPNESPNDPDAPPVDPNEGPNDPAPVADAEAPGTTAELGDWRVRVVSASTSTDVVQVRVALSWAGSGSGKRSDLSLRINQDGQDVTPGGAGCPAGSDTIAGPDIGSDPVEVNLCFLVPNADLDEATLLAEAMSAQTTSLFLQLR